MSPLYLCFYFYVIFNTETKILGMHTEVIGTNLEILVQCLTLPLGVQKKKNFLVIQCGFQILGNFSDVQSKDFSAQVK